MSKQLIKPSKALGYSNIYLDFINSSEKAAGFYLATDPHKTASQLDAVNYDRSAIVDILTRQNESYGATEQTLANIKRLSDPKALCIFAGQQAGLFGGPMFTIIKGIALIKAAQKYEKELNRPVIPIFWIAGDDHDFDEVNHVALLDRSSELVSLVYPTPPETALSVADIKFTDAEKLEQAKESYRSALGETDFTEPLYKLLDQAYTPDDSFVSAFGKLISGLLGKLGLVLFCPSDTAAKKLNAPFLKTILNRQDEIHTAINAANAKLTENGFHIQVEKKESSTHLFYNLDGRKPVLRDGVNFMVGEKVFTKSELETLLDKQPERFSPDVMTRPVLQSYMFPTLIQYGGPAEIAYLAQINPLFELFDRPAPIHQARPTVTLIETRYEKLMATYEIPFEELTGDIEQLINRILTKSFPDDIEKHFEELREGVEGHFSRFIGEALEFDQSLKKYASQVFGKVDYNLKNFESKVFATHKKHSQATRDRIYKLGHALYPNRGFQERTVNVGYFIARYGTEFINFLYEQMEVDEKSHQLIYLSEMSDR